ncbi:MAG: VWA domain-containing protein [Acidobacteriota bacterium]
MGGWAPVANAQQPQAKAQNDDVLRISAELVQTAITVLDKNGHFVEGLDSGQFELTVDGKPRPISFFERVTAGSAREEQLATRAESGPTPTKAPATPPTVRGRTIVFFVDDLHLSPDSMNRTKQMLRRFLDNEMSSRDSVAITSASGQIGFLQQFTNNKQVLDAAMTRLSPRPYDVRSFGTGSTKMREFDALSIDSSSGKANGEILNFYIRECVVQASAPKTIPVARAAIAAMCETDVRNSARAVLMQAGNITQNMYASLESLIRSSARAPGRKLAFFISDGFLMDTGPHGPGLRGKLDSIIDAARRSGVVVYTIDSRGLVTDRVDLTQSNARLDVGAPVGEIMAYQDAMNGLAEDTGGRALRNQNYFDRWVEKVLDETSNYYLLAWRPDKEEEKAPKFRHVKVTVAGRPDLTVRAPRGYVDGPLPVSETAAVSAAQMSSGGPKAKTPEAELGAALSDYYPSSALPTILSLTYLNTPKNETVLTASIQIANRGLHYGDEGKQPATIKLAGVILNDKGKFVSSFKNQLSVNPLNARESDASGVIYNQHTPLAPGIYQVRVATRDEKSGHVGSAMQWIVIPDLTTRQLSTSSVLLGGQVLENATNKDADLQIQLSVDHRFSRLTRLGYWMFIYNAKRDAAGAPNLTAQTQVLHNGQVMLTSPQRKVNQGGTDPARIPFGEEMALQTLLPGSYDLRVTITDGLAGSSITQTVDFEVR